MTNCSIMLPQKWQEHLFRTGRKKLIMLSLSQNPADQYSKRNFHRHDKTDNNILKIDYSSLYCPYAEATFKK